MFWYFEIAISALLSELLKYAFFTSGIQPIIEIYNYFEKDGAYLRI